MSVRSGEKKTILRIVVDSVILILLTVLLSLKGHFQPVRRGYFCDDETISYPFKRSTVPESMLYGVGIGLPLAIILLSEFFHSPKPEETSETKVLFGWRVPTKLQNIYIYVVPFLFGVLITEIVTDFIKLSVGRLRPFFLDACLPDFDCATAEDPHVYVMDYNCTNPNTHRNTNNIRLSFPSGHTSLGTYAVLYAVVYIHRRPTVSFSDFSKPLLQLIVVLLGAFNSFSRMHDNKHHWSDIFGGFVLGVLAFFAIDNVFPSRSPTPFNHSNGKSDSGTKVTEIKI